MKLEVDITDEQLKKEGEIVKFVDMSLYAERIAIEIKAYFEVYNYGHSSFKSYLVTANYTYKLYRKWKIKSTRNNRKILIEKYNIKILSTVPFVIAND